MAVRRLTIPPPFRRTAGAAWRIADGQTDAVRSTRKGDFESREKQRERERWKETDSAAGDAKERQGGKRGEKEREGEFFPRGETVPRRGGRSTFRATTRGRLSARTRTTPTPSTPTTCRLDSLRLTPLRRVLPRLASTTLAVYNG